ncbi:BspA family leucine-rich repeat surface protein [Bernardetia sp. ABR2-2B]|uniref:BspA family leucine-rich repeat surface protein n=1 Tax=Bernardetia sp. ABR2-2B TaxID=3127472 RepID=UPI0030D3E9CB
MSLPILTSLRKTYFLSCLVLLFSLFINSISAQNEWQYVGVPQFAIGGTEPNIEFRPSFNEPYVAHQGGSSNEANVSKYTSASIWEKVGAPNFSGNSSSKHSIAFNSAGDPYVVYHLTSLSIVVKRFTGSAWLDVDAEVSSGNLSSPSIAIDPATGIPYVSYIDNDTDELHVRRYNGTTWVQVGSTTNDARSSSIAFGSSPNEPYVAYIDNTTNTINVKSFDGSSWITVGAPDFSNRISIGDVKLAFNSNRDEFYVTYTDFDASNRISVMNFDGSSWNFVGAAGTGGTNGESQGDIDFDLSNGNPYIALKSPSNQLKVRFFDGSTWEEVGNATLPSVNIDAPSIALHPFTNQPYVAFREGVMLSVMRFAPVYYSNGGGTWNTPTTWSHNPCGGTQSPASNFPTGDDKVVICDGDIVNSNTPNSCGTLIIEDGECNTTSDNFTVNGNITINNAGTFRHNANFQRITFKGSIVNSGTFTTGGTGTFQFTFRGNIINNGNFDLQSSSQSTFDTNPVVITNNNADMIFSAGATSGSCNINSNVTITNGLSTGSVRLFGNSGLNIASTATLTNNYTNGELWTSTINGVTGATLENNGVINYRSSQTPTVTNFNNNVGSTFIYSISSAGAGNANVRAGTYHHIEFGSSAGSHLLGDIVVNGNLSFSGTTRVLHSNTHNIDIKGNWNTLNLNNFNSSTGGTVTFSGTTPQAITGATDFHNLVINNTFFFDPTVTLQPNSPVGVSNDLTLTNGRLVLGNNNLSYPATGSITRTNGWVETNSTTGFFVLTTNTAPFTFPVGSATDYQPLEITISVNGSRVRFGTSTIAVPNSGIGSWFVRNENQASEITLIDPKPTANIDGTSQIRRYNGSAWDVLATTFSTPNYSTTSPFNFSTGVIEEFSVFTQPSDPFITTWVATGGTITIPTTGTGYNYDITWTNLTNAGVNEGTITARTGNYTITGLEDGSTYQIDITGDFPHIYFNDTGDKAKLLTIEQWGDIEWTSMESAFYGCINLEVNATDVPRLTNVTNFSRMFRGAENMILPSDINAWDTQNGTTFFGMFFNCKKFNSDLSNWNVSSGANFTNVFSGAIIFDQNLGNWVMSSATNVSGMLDNTALSVNNYDATLTGWSSQTLISGRTLGAVGLNYCNAVVERNILINPATNNWTITGDALASPTCLPSQPIGNRGMYFDGVNDYVDMGDVLNTTFAGDFTLEAWVKQSTLKDNVVLAKWRTGIASVFNFSINSAGRLRIQNNVGSNVSSSVQLTEINRWYHVAVSSDNASNLVTLYVNGVVVGSGTLSFNTVSSQSLLVGTRLDNTSSPESVFHGQIDEVKVFSEVLDEGQIQATMGSSATNTTGLVGYWDFEDGESQIVEDVTINTNDGQLGSTAVGDVNDPLWALRVKNTNDSGTESFREVITQANGLVGKNHIDFSIPNSAPHTITLSSNLDDISESVFIDGTSQEGFTPYSSTGMVQINGGATATRLTRFTAGNDSEIYGLWIKDFISNGLMINGANNTRIGGINKANVIGGIDDGSINGTAIEVSSGSNTVIMGNRLGTNPEGTASDANTGHGINIQTPSTNVVIGGQRGATIGDQGEGNLISGNERSGIILFNNGHTIQGNIIGLDINQNNLIPNVQNGISTLCSTCTTASPLNIIGGDLTTNEGNIIGGNNVGIEIGSPNTTVLGNLIGLNQNDIAKPNTFNGIQINNYFSSVNPSGIAIGSTTIAERNVISGNGGMGIRVTGAENSQIFGNYVGTNIAGITAVPNTGIGVSIERANNTLGGATPAHGNIISGNGGNGVEVSQAAATGNTVQNNKIGVNVIGNALGNTGTGLLFQFGNINTAINNEIAHNGSFGVRVGSCADIDIIENQIYCNSGDGIDLFFGTGNNNQAAPVITAADVTTDIVSGTGLNGNVIHLYRNPDPSTCGSSPTPQEYLGTTIVVSGVWSITSSFTLLAGDRLVATQTDSADGTSPFSTEFIITEITLGTITPASPYCAGETISIPFTTTGTFNGGNTFTAQLSDASGNFTTPTATQVGTSPISLVIPNGTGTGTGYRVRVVSSDPVVTSDISAAITINARPTVELSVTSNTGSEADATEITVTATASSTVVGDQTVNLAVTGTGITTGDYTLSSSTITITGGTTTGSVTFTVVDDAITEPDEVAILTISSPSACIALGTTVSQNITITDNDQQEINVQGGSPLTDIADGSTTPLVANDTDFGSVIECGTNTIVKTYTIQNTGVADLNISGITVTNPSDFTLSGLPTFPTIIAASGVQTFTVTFDPTAIGNRTAIINIANDDADENPYTFTISGTGQADNVAPVVPTLADVTAQCSVASIPAPTTSDNCDGTLTGTTTQTFPITSSTTVVWTFTDVAGNSITANQNVIIDDTTDPVVPTLTDITAQCSVASIPAPTTSDNCDGTLTGTTTQTFPITSSTTVVWTFTDVAGNSITANQNVIIDDTTDPVVPTLTDVTAQCSVASIPAPTTSDNCDGTLTGTTTQTFPITSSTTVVWTFTDAAGNSVTANQNVIIDDTTDPVVPTLTDVTAQCSVASIPAPTTSDNCDGTLTGTTTQTFPITSSTTVVWTFTDVAGNSITANQNVIIDDTTDPVVPTLTDVTAQCSVASIPAPTTSDNCDGTLTGTTTQTFPITSSTTVVWTFTDAAGNSVTANQNVIIDDTTDPVVPTLTDVTAQCSVASIPAPTTSDNCDGTLTGTTTQTFPITTQGTTIVTWTFTDGNGNIVTADQNVIINDNTDPTLNTPLQSNVTVTPNQGCSFINRVISNSYINNGTATDNCGIDRIEYELTGATTGTVATLVNQVFNEGATTVTWKAIDDSGNESTPSTFTVTVVDSNQPPRLFAMRDFTRRTDLRNCYYTNRTTVFSNRIPDGRAIDNCGVASYRYLLSGATLGDVSSLEGIRFNQGVTDVIWTATDRNGNTSAPNQFTITIMDNRNPIIRAPQNITRLTNLYGCTSTIDSLDIGTPIASDNCLFRVFNDAPAEFPLGETVVTWTAIDSAGNTATDEQIVTIEQQYYVTPSDSLILVDIYNEMGGASWNTSWDLNTPVSTWNGVAVSCGNVAALNLSSNNLTGILPSSVLDLERITEGNFLLNIKGNRLNFASAESFVGRIPNFIYSPQAKIYATRTESVGQTESITFSSQTEGDFNLYQWYKDENAIAGATNWDYTITSAVPSDAGVYTCKVSNTVATQLVLERNPITLEVEGFVNSTDSLALVQLFLGTGGQTSWTEVWDLTQPVSTWSGVTLSGSKITELDLSSRNLTGTLPDVFDAELFSELRYLSFFDNKLDGQIPSSIGAITTLTYLDLDKNNFEGSVPASLGNLTNLQAFWLSRNNLTSLPNEIGNMRSLRTFYLNENQFEELPETIGNLSELLILNVSDNELKELPNTITNLTKLIEFYSNRNYITSVPTEIQRLVSLRTFEINTNNLSSLPIGFTQISSLAKFRVSENELEFDDLLPYANQNYSTFEYAPQAPINEEENILAVLNSSLTLTVDTEGSGNNYEWFKNGNSVEMSQDLVISRISNSDVGTYIAQVTNSSLPGLTLQRRSILLNVKCPEGLNFEIEEPAQTVFCESQPFGLKLEAITQFTDAQKISWRKDGVILAFANEQSYTVTSAGVYTAEVLTANGCTALSNSVEITVLPQPEISIELINEELLTSTLNSQEPVTYQWLKDGVPIENASENTYTPTETAEYSLLVLTEAGCSSISETILFTKTITAIEEPKEFRDLEIFPNPNNGNFFIDFGTITQNGEPTFILIDAIGRKITLKTERISSSRYKIKTNNLAGGMYHLQIQTKDGIAFRKFVVEE